MTHTTHSVTKWAFVVGFMIVLNLFFNYAVSLVYEKPVWDDYVGRNYIPGDYDEEGCVLVGGKWYAPDPRLASPQKENLPPGDGGWCDPNYTAQEEYNRAERMYERNVFIILVGLGVLSIVTGIFIAVPVLALGLSWGGVLSLVIASLRFWNEAGNILKVAILFVALVSLVYIAMKKFRRDL